MIVLVRLLRFLIDESGDARVAAWLRSLGHDAVTVAQHHRPGLDDAEVLAIARAEGRVLITDDRDFGELVFRQGHLHAGIIYLRLGTTVPDVRIDRLNYVLTHHVEELDQFLVVSPHRVRIRRA